MRIFEIVTTPKSRTKYFPIPKIVIFTAKQSKRVYRVFVKVSSLEI